MRFDAVRLFSAGIWQVYGLRQQGTNIENEIAAVSADSGLKIVQNLFQRPDCKRARDGYAKEIEFHS